MVAVPPGGGALQWNRRRAVKIYRYLTHSVGGFIQQAAVYYLQRGYWFYVLGQIPKGKSPHSIDQKILAKYQIGLSKDQCYRRKRQGKANVQYLRYRETFLLLATEGTHPLFAEEKATLRDARTSPLRVFGYALSVKNGRVLVRLNEPTFRRLKAGFRRLALRGEPDLLVRKFQTLPFEPYRPVYRQLRSIWKTVNRQRKTAGLPLVPRSALRTRRRSFRSFESGKEGKTPANGQAGEREQEGEPRTARLRPLRGP